MNSCACAASAADSTSSRRAGFAKGDVIGNRTREEENILFDDGDLLPQGCQISVADFHTVHFDGAAGCVVDAVDKFDEAGLARAGLPDNGNGLSRLGLNEISSTRFPPSLYSNKHTPNCTTFDLPIEACRVLVEVALAVDQFEDAARARKPQRHSGCRQRWKRMSEIPAGGAGRSRPPRRQQKCRRRDTKGASGTVPPHR